VSPARFRAWATLDPRSLAAFRISFALLLLVDLAQRASDLRAFYTDEGVLPRAAFEPMEWDFAWSLHRLGGSAPYEAVLFVLAAVAAVGLLVGYRTFWMTLACWLLTASLHARNPLIRDGQDDISRVLLFWMLFVPLGAAASLDSRAGRSSHPLQRPDETGSWGSVAFVLQLFVMYWVSALGKLLSPWWRAGDGMFYALHVGRYQTAFGQWLSDQPGLNVASYGVFLLEALGPVAWILLRSTRQRLAVAGAFFALHAGFALCMNLGSFPYFCIVAWMALLPSGLWDRLGWRPSTPRMPSEVGAAALFARGAAAVLPLAGGVVLWCNLLYLFPEWGLPQWPQRMAEVVGLQQYWVLFSPRRSGPFALSDGWWVIPAVLQDGKQVDLEQGGRPVEWGRPPLVSHSFPNSRWRHYFANAANLLLPFPPNSTQYKTLERSRAAFAHWLCREWNESHEPSQRINYVSLFLMRYRFDRPAQPPQRELLFQDACVADGQRRGEVPSLRGGG
jgi:hypothetical protein